MDAFNSTPNPMLMMKERVETKREGGMLVPRSSTAFSSELLIQNHSNFKRSSCPERFMFYEDGSWVNYRNDVEKVLRVGFQEGKPMIEGQVLGCNCIFDFYRMLEIDLDTGNQRSIAWIDVDGKCFFPKYFVNSYEDDREDDFVNCHRNYPKIEIDIKIRENSASSDGLELNNTVNLNKRKREENVQKEQIDGSSSSTNKKRRQLVVSESQSARWPKARVLRAEEKGYTIVKDLFMSGLITVDPGATLTSIHQCVRTGPLEKARFEVFGKQMEIMKRARGGSNMVFAWFGTSADAVESILTRGFGMRSKSLQSKGHGVGVHLSHIRSPQDSAKLSEMDENGEKHVILCRLILGKCEKVEADSQQSYPSSVEYDTGVDDLNNPRWYTVWHSNMNTHILPECVVSYRPVNISGSLKGLSKASNVPSLSVFVAKLVSKLRSSLPLPRIQELQTLWVSCKEGKMAKDVFMKQLRSFVGDDILRSTIQEIRG